MQLAYLIFDGTDDDTGACSFDAMGSVLPDRLPALVREAEAVLAWAHRAFGAPLADAEAGEWDFELQATGEHEGPLPFAYDAGRARMTVPTEVRGRVTLALTLGGSSAFAAAFREAFPETD